MKRISDLIVVLIFVMAMVSGCSEKEGEIIVKTPEIDLGKIEIATPITNLVSVENKSNKDFIIKNVKASCGCQKPQLPKKIITAGEKFDFRVETMRMESGPFRNLITLIPEGDNFKPLKVIFKGNAIRTLKTTLAWADKALKVHADYNDYVNLGSAPQGNKSKLRLIVSDLNESADLKQRGISLIDSAYFDLTNSNSQFDEELKLSFKKQFSPGFYKDRLVIKTFDGRNIVANIIFKINGGIYIEPATIDLSFYNGIEGNLRGQTPFKSLPLKHLRGHLAAFLSCFDS